LSAEAMNRLLGARRQSAFGPQKPTNRRDSFVTFRQTTTTRRWDRTIDE
jgi:hypothetical protein